MPKTNNMYDIDKKTLKRTAEAAWKGIHFHTPTCPHFLEADYKLEVTDESIKRFVASDGGRGFICVVDISQNPGKIHLIPSFNNQDGFLRCDKNGTPFSTNDSANLYVAEELAGQLGDLPSQLHAQAARFLHIDSLTQQGQLMGLAIWKGGVGIRFLDTLPDIEDPSIATENLRFVPHEYLVGRDWRSGKVILLYVNNKRTITEVTDVEPSLQEALLQIPDSVHDMSALTMEQRMPIEILLRKRHENDKEEVIKFAKNRSTSQNQYACQYTQEYRIYLSEKAKETAAGPHANILKRELPVFIFQKIMDSITTELSEQNLNSSKKIDVMTIVPSNEGDTLNFHLFAEKTFILWKESIFKSAFKKLEDNARLNQSTIALLTLYPAYAGLIADELLALSPDDFQKLSSNSDVEVSILKKIGATNIVEALEILKKENLLSPENRAMIGHFHKSSVIIATAFVTLKKAGVAITDEIADLIWHHPDHANEIATALIDVKDIRERKIQIKNKKGMTSQ